MGSKLERIAEISANWRKPEFTSLYHHINDDMLKQCHKELNGNKAVGIDRIIANSYMHNVLMLWYKVIITKETKGGAF